MSNTLGEDEGAKTSEVGLLGLDVKLLRKRLSIIFPIIFWPNV